MVEEGIYMDYSKTPQAKKVCEIIKGLYSLAKARFCDRFTIRFFDMDTAEVPHIGDSEPYFYLYVSVWEEESGEQVLFVHYLKRNATSKQKVNYQAYHKRLLHEYAEVFLFHNGPFNPPGAPEDITVAEREASCDQFADLHFDLAQFL